MIDPLVSVMTFASSPSGLQVTLDGQPLLTPTAVTGVVGFRRSIDTPSPQTSGGNTVTFASWSDGGAKSHTITTPAANQTFTASFSGGPTTTVRPTTTSTSSSTSTTAPSPTTTTTTLPGTSAWPPTATPPGFAGADAPVELGVKFRADVAGTVAGIRFYKGALNTGTHTGSLWTASGTRLATATFTGETASGWQKVFFTPPVAIAANTVYVASYFCPNGGFAISANFFAQGVDNPPLHLLADGVSGANGVFTYAATSTFPTSTYAKSNYWVDVAFTPTAPSTTTTSSSTSTTAPVPTTTSTTVPRSVWPSTATPPGFAGADAPVELGVKFRADVAGTVAGIRFYKGALNTGTHTGSLWTASGTRLATATFTGETASGWQKVFFTPPVAIAANTVYVASYFCPNGGFAISANFFAQGVDNPPLHLLADGVSGANGVFTYAATSTFPTSTYAKSNYWVDVAFTPAAPSTTTSSTSSSTSTSTTTSSSTSTTAPVPTTTTTTLPRSVWPPTATPPGFAGADAPVELGVKFRADVAGNVTGIRFYKGTSTRAPTPGVCGRRRGRAWRPRRSPARPRPAGSRSRSRRRWRSTPTPSTSRRTSAPTAALRARRTSSRRGSTIRRCTSWRTASRAANGVFTYAATSTFPSSTYAKSNYWVDVVFTPSTASTTTTSSTSTTSTTLASSLPALWDQQDVGAVGVTGSGTYAAGTATFTVQGSGADIIAAADAFRFVYRTMTGNGEIVARVTSLAGPHGWTKAGVMIRKSLTAGSEHATFVVSPSNGSTYQRRRTSGGNTTNTDAPGSVPLWVRLVRSGDTFTAYRSTDGVAWALVGSDTIPMNTSVYVGLAVTSHDNTALATATFTNVTVTGGGVLSTTTTTSSTTTSTTLAASLQNITTLGTTIALIYQPTGAGQNIAVIRDGDKPPVSSTDGSRQYDTYVGATGRAVDWIGYSSPPPASSGASSSRRACTSPTAAGSPLSGSRSATPGSGRP